MFMSVARSPRRRPLACHSSPRKIGDRNCLEPKFARIPLLSNFGAR